jgi:hypothetical protein
MVLPLNIDMEVKNVRQACCAQDRYRELSPLRWNSHHRMYFLMVCLLLG